MQFLHHMLANFALYMAIVSALVLILDTVYLFSLFAILSSETTIGKQPSGVSRAFGGLFVPSGSSAAPRSGYLVPPPPAVPLQSDEGQGQP